MLERRGISIVRDHLCPFCKLPVDVRPLSLQRALVVTCPCCGKYRLTAEAESAVTGMTYSDERWSAVSYQIRRLSGDGSALITQQTLRDIFDHATLPSPSEAIDSVVIWLATESRWPGAYVQIRDPQQRAVVGAHDAHAFEAYLDWLLETGWVSGKLMSPMDGPGMMATLTPKGWDHYRQLLSSGIASRNAFMAMQFDDEQLDSVFNDVFMPAVKKTGFDLRRVTDGQGAGLIDDQMRVAIRTARFVLCDLTHSNRGAYWEAGFAEGLGKPVIYTCRVDVFSSSDPAIRPHFDTGHLVTVVWDPEKLRQAAELLKARIRATLPSEAFLEDV